MTAPTTASESDRIAALEAKIARLEATSPPAPVPVTTRRHALRHLALAAAGGALATVVGGQDRVAAVHDPEDLGLGITNTVTGFTRLDSNVVTSGAAVVFQAVHAATQTPFANQAADFSAALAGWTVSPTQPHGVFGYTSQDDGYGVVGVGSAAGVFASGDVGIEAQGVQAALRLAAADQVLAVLVPDRVSDSTTRTAPPSRTTAHVRGMVDLDRNYDLWLCVADGTPGTWRKLSGPATAGAFHAVTPGRVYDSRLAMPGPATALSLGVARTISVAGRRDITTGEVVQTDFVPAGATAIACNVTVANTTGSGFLVGNPGGVTAIGAATINWSTSGQILNNGVILTLNGARELTLVAGGSSGSSAHVVVDVTGYYR